MSKLEQRILKNDIHQAEKNLISVAYERGKASPEYKSALQRFVRLWAILKMTRSKDEFFGEVTSQD